MFSFRNSNYVIRSSNYVFPSCIGSYPDDVRQRRHLAAARLIKTMTLHRFNVLIGRAVASHTLTLHTFNVWFLETSTLTVDVSLLKAHMRF